MAGPEGVTPMGTTCNPEPVADIIAGKELCAYLWVTGIDIVRVVWRWPVKPGVHYPSRKRPVLLRLWNCAVSQLSREDPHLLGIKGSHEREAVAGRVDRLKLNPLSAQGEGTRVDLAIDRLLPDITGNADEKLVIQQRSFGPDFIKFDISEA